MVAGVRRGSACETAFAHGRAMEWSLRIGTSAAGNYFEGGVACAAARRRPPRPTRDHRTRPARPDMGGRGRESLYFVLFFAEFFG